MASSRLNTGGVCSLQSSGRTLVSSADVVRAYRAVLYKDPDSEAIAACAAAFRTYRSLERALLECEERRAIAQALPADGRRIVFLHSPKTGGMSLRASLSQQFPAGSVFPEQYDKLHRYGAGTLAPHRLFAGHFSYSSLWRIPGAYDVITMVREPGARLLSFYYFIRSHRLDYLEEVAPPLAEVKKMSLDRFLLEGAPGVVRMVDQFGDGDPALAAARLAGVAAIGVTEQFDLSLQLLSHRLRMPLAKVPKQNVTGRRTTERWFEDTPPEREPVTAALWSALSEVTRADQPLYRLAVRRFRRDAMWHRLTTGLFARSTDFPTVPASGTQP